MVTDLWFNHDSQTFCGFILNPRLNFEAMMSINITGFESK